MDMVSDRQTIAHCAVWVQQTIPGAAVKELSSSGREYRSGILNFHLKVQQLSDIDIQLRWR